MTNELVTHIGGCHCGAVRFEFDAPSKVVVHDCNCSICAMTGYQHLIVPATRFRLLTNKAALRTYTFNTGVAQHPFCTTCGIKSYYVPRSNPDGFSINMRCVDQTTFDDVQFEPFDGQNWEDHATNLAHLSKP